MRVAELLDDADLPIIYDIVKKKVEADEQVIIAGTGPDEAYLLLKVYRMDDHKYVAGLDWVCLDLNDPDSPGITSGDCYTLKQVKNWKLNKIDTGRWELRL
jgi:hypothetical protein